MVADMTRARALLGGAAGAATNHDGGVDLDGGQDK